MKHDIDIIDLRQPETVTDPLTEIARDGARRMLAAALRAEADNFVAHHAGETLPDGRQRVVRHGYGQERSIQTKIGAGRSAPEGSRPRHQSGGWGKAPLHFEHSAELGAALAQPRCPAARALPAWHLDGESLGGAGRDPG